MSLTFPTSKQNAAFKSARTTIEECVSTFGRASRRFASQQLDNWADVFTDEDKSACMAELERLGLIPPVQVLRFPISR